MKPSLRLPHILREVAEIAGEEAALRLARVRGGRRMYVPATPTAGLTAEIGAEAAGALARLYGNENITVPLGPTGSLSQVRRAIGEALQGGASAAEAAEAAGVTQRTIYNHRRRRKERDARQPRLFGD